MAEVTVVLKRVNQKGHIVFEAPSDPETQMALRNVLHIVPKRERDCDTEECGKLIEASHMLAAQLGITLREAEDE